MPVSVDNLRSYFDKWFPPSHPLRSLASEIASFPASSAGPFIATAAEYHPANFLANGQTGHRALPIWSRSCVDSLAIWKFGDCATDESRHGFGDKGASQGLAYLFDPTVDYALASHLQLHGSLPENPRVIVLTDYYPIGSSYLEKTLFAALCPTSPKDWADGQVNDHNPIACWNNSPTFRGLKKLLPSTRNNIHLGNILTDPANDLFVANNVLLWNFLPMFRGGPEATNESGLPRSDDYKFICVDWMVRFLKGVNAHRALICSNKFTLTIKRVDPTSSPEYFRIPGAASTWPPRAMAKVRDYLEQKIKGAHPPLQECYRLYQPYVWNMFANHFSVAQYALR